MKDLELRQKLIIRADGNGQMGLGHIYRCLALAQMLKDHFQIIFLTCEQVAQEIITSYNFEVQLFSSTLTSEQELQLIKNHVHDKAIVVLDGYHFGESYQRTLKEVLPQECKICGIVDESQERTFCDALINHNAHARLQDYLHTKIEQKHLALGNSYLLLRDAFMAKKEWKSRNSLKRVLIAIGGADPKGYGPQMAKVIKEFNPEISVGLIAGSANAISDKRFIDDLYSNLNDRQMSELYQSNDLLIASASMTAWEACACHIPLAVLSWASNQIPIAKSLVELEAAFDLGHLSTDHIEGHLDFMTRLKQILAQEDRLALLQKKQEQIIDGLSPHRIQKFFEELKEPCYAS